MTAPYINIESSKFIEDGFKKIFGNKTSTDVLFHVQTRDLHAHKIILCASSRLFCKLLCPDVLNKEKALTSSDVNAGSVPGLSAMKTLENGTIEFTVNESISAEAFSFVLEFLYSGSIDVKNKSMLSELISCAKTFDVSEMENFLINLKDNSLELNPSITTWFNDERGQMLKRNFMNKEWLADVRFKSVDKIVPAHKTVLSCYCEVMNAMLNSDFVESEQEVIEIEDECDPEAFLALLTFIYADRAAVDEANPISLLILANQYNQTRLVTLCEVYIAKMVEKATEKSVEHANINVVELLHIAQLHNAKQLEKFCLHFLSVNYQPMKKKEEFNELSGENLKYVEEHQWPPQSYFKELEKYENELKKQNGDQKDKTCVVM